MKWLLIAAPIVAALLAGALTIIIIGALLPRHHTATRSVRLAAGVDRIWAIITDFERRAEWVPGVKAVQRLPDRNGHPVWNDVRADGWHMPIEIASLEPPRRLVGRIADDRLPFGGTWTWEITPEGTGSRLRITEDGEIKVAPFRYFAALGDMTSTMRQTLLAIGRRLDEDVTIEP